MSYEPTYEPKTLSNFCILNATCPMNAGRRAIIFSEARKKVREIFIQANP